VQTKTILGYEALTRGPEKTELYSPDKLFHYATAHNLLSELEILCRDKAITRFAELQLQGKLFLNISPLVLLNKNHPQGFYLTKPALNPVKSYPEYLSANYQYKNAVKLSLISHA
jgi:hypothetical protein